MLIPCSKRAFFKRFALHCFRSRISCPVNLRQCSVINSPWRSQQLTSRTVIRLAGTGAASYLQGLITNDMKHLTEGSTDCMFAMFLNSKGRVLYDSLIYNDAKESFLIEADAKIASELVRHLNMFKVRRKLSIESLGDSLSVWHANNAVEVPEAAPIKLSDAIQETLSKADVRTFKDPRCAGLGYRILSSRQDISSILSKNDIHQSGEFYNRTRYELGVAEGIAELPPGNCFALESNCDYMHGVSFHKGCYLGQEVTARTHHTGVVRKRIMPLIFEKVVAQISVDTPVTGDSDKSVGKLRGVDKDRGVALLRIEEVLKAANLCVDGKRCTTHRPAWWPAEAPKGRPT